MLGKVVGGVFDSGASVLIHCMAGIHRAPMCAAGALSIVRQLRFEEAYKLIVDSGRYVEPHRFEQYVGHDAVRAMLRCVADVQWVSKKPQSSVAVRPERCSETHVVDSVSCGGDLGGGANKWKLHLRRICR